MMKPKDDSYRLSHEETDRLYCALRALGGAAIQMNLLNFWVGRAHHAQPGTPSKFYLVKRDPHTHTYVRVPVARPRTEEDFKRLANMALLLM